jgi:hypothetical protein
VGLSGPPGRHGGGGSASSASPARRTRRAARRLRAARHLRARAWTAAGRRGRSVVGGAESGVRARALRREGAESPALRRYPSVLHSVGRRADRRMLRCRCCSAQCISRQRRWSWRARRGLPSAPSCFLRSSHAPQRSGATRLLQLTCAGPAAAAGARRLASAAVRVGDAARRHGSPTRGASPARALLSRCGVSTFGGVLPSCGAAW